MLASLKQLEAEMRVEKREVQYKFRNMDYHHHVIYLRDGKNQVLISPFNLFLKDRASASMRTSKRYAGNICNFLNFILKRYESDGVKFWRNASEEDLREWQHSQVKAREKNRKTKPSDKTIHENASLIHDLYLWLRKNKFPVSIHLETKDWKFNFKEESLLKHVRSQLTRSGADHKGISAGLARTQDPNKNDFTIMSLNDRVRLMEAYYDPVYAACFMLALATGMREEGICRVPYLGTGENIHIRPYPEILSEIGDKKTFPFKVVEKGKERTLDVNLQAWKATCLMYLPLYFKRRKLLQRKHPEINPDSVFFITSYGHPVTPERISRMTYVAKKKLKDFPWTFHSARSWYATQYMINHLSKDQIKASYYNAAVEEGLRRQLGHSDIKTTYKHYLRMASLAIALKDGDIGQSTWRDLEEMAGKVVDTFSEN